MFQLGWLLHPIFSASGDYPPVMKEWLAKKSKEEGYRRSRLPSFTKQEVEMVRGEFDFISTKSGCRTKDKLAGYDVITPVEMDNIILLCLTPCRPIKFNKNVVGISSLRLQGRSRRVCFFPVPVSFTFPPLKRRQKVLSRR
jgi:hypothetical protein